MRKIVFILSVILVFGSVRPASAHVFKTDGTVTVLMHANPDDDPIAAQPASLLFGVTDSNNKFDAAKCDCKISISDKNKRLLDAPLLRIDGGAPSLYGLTIPVTFPEKAVYSIVVTGTPKIAGAFQGFQVQYDLRVDRTAGDTKTGNPASHQLFYPFLGVLFVGVFGYYSIRRLKKRKKGDHGNSTLTGIFLLVTLVGLSLHHAALAAEFCPDHNTAGQIQSCCFPIQTQLPAKASFESRKIVFIWEQIKVVEVSYVFHEIINNKSPPLGSA